MPITVPDWLFAILLLPYAGAALLVAVYNLGQLHLLWLVRRARPLPTPPPPARWPTVTIQLPVYNERHVVDRLLQAVSRLDYPSDLLHVQILDDSTDDTPQLIAALLPVLQQRGFRVEHVRRASRHGFKAGALKAGLATITSEVVALFDADFLPPADFLRRTIPVLLSDPTVGAVQTRWTHLNARYSLLTRVQAFWLDAHFLVEQRARAAAGLLLNFNGTAGIWRRSCILAAGGWQADTLTEDLDLSFRAQLDGWQIRYCPDVHVPAELPAEISALTTQQFRWMKGSAECARKLLPAVWRSQRPRLTKLHASLQLMGSTVFGAGLVLALLSVPILLIRPHAPAWATNVLRFVDGLWLTMIPLGAIYWTAFRASGSAPRSRLAALARFSSNFGLLLLLQLSLSLRNAWAATSGWLGRRTPFHRTPKFCLEGRRGSWLSAYAPSTSLTPTQYLELGLGLYFLVGLSLAVQRGEFRAIPFHLMLAAVFIALGSAPLWQHLTLGRRISREAEPVATP